MRITIINQYYPPDVAATAYLTKSLAEHRASLGDDVRVLTGRGSYVHVESGASEESEESEDQAKIHRLWSTNLGKTRLLFRAADYASFYLQVALRMIFLPRQDVIITLTTPPHIGLTAMLHKCLHPSTKIILWNMDCYPDAPEAAGIIKPGGWPSRIMRWLVKLQLSSVAHVVTLDDAMSNRVGRLANAGRMPPITVIPNWERASQFPRPTVQHRFTQWGERPLCVLYLGNAGYFHTFDTVIEVAQKLRNKPVRFVFVGGGKRWQEIAEAKERLGLNNIELQNYVPKDQTLALLAAADFALITLQDDGLGICSPSKLHSTLAMGIPVVYVGPEGSNVDSAVREFDCGVSLRVGDVDGLIHYVEMMHQDLQTYRRQSENARGAFEHRFSDERTLPRFDEIIQALSGCSQAIRDPISQAV